MNQHKTADPHSPQPSLRLGRFVRRGSMIAVLGFAIHVLLPHIAGSALSETVH